jgi:hypothetical protein
MEVYGGQGGGELGYCMLRYRAGGQAAAKSVVKL